MVSFLRRSEHNSFTDASSTVLSYRQVMELVLRYSDRSRLILSLPFWVGMLQGTVLEQLPPNLFTVTRSQVCLSLEGVSSLDLMLYVHLGQAARAG